MLGHVGKQLQWFAATYSDSETQKLVACPVTPGVSLATKCAFDSAPHAYECAYDPGGNCRGGRGHYHGYPVSTAGRWRRQRPPTWTRQGTGTE